MNVHSILLTQKLSAAYSVLTVLKTLLFKAGMIALGRYKERIAKSAKRLGSINTRLQSHCVKVCVWSYARLDLLGGKFNT